MPGSQRVLHRSTTANAGRRFIDQPQMPLKHPQRQLQRAEAIIIVYPDVPGKEKLKTAIMSQVQKFTKVSTTFQPGHEKYGKAVAGVAQVMKSWNNPRGTVADYLSNMDEKSFKNFIKALDSCQLIKKTDISNLQTVVRTVRAKKEQAVRRRIEQEQARAFQAAQHTNRPSSSDSDDSIEALRRQVEALDFGDQRTRASSTHSTDSDDSDRSVAAGAVSDESKAIEALRARLKAAFTTSESLMAKYREILARKPQKTTELETKLYAKMRETISKTTKQADLGSRNLEEFDSAQLKELIDMTTVTNRQTRHNLTTMLDYLS